jgi:hypothetical protein
MRFRVFIDRQVPGAAHGIGVDGEGNGTVTEQRLYQLIAVRQFEIQLLDAGVEAYAFTFSRSKTVNSQTGGSRCWISISITVTKI